MERFNRRRRQHSATMTLPDKSSSQLKDVNGDSERRCQFTQYGCFWARRLLLVAAFSWTIWIMLTFSATLVLSNANKLGRQCITEAEEERSSDLSSGLSFALVSCSDGLSTVPQRSFQGIMDLVSPNKENYARKHGYTYIDASNLLDRERPPSWSKIKAVREHLGQYDWIFWNDADSLVTNFSVTLEDVLSSCLAAHHNNVPDMIITEDVTGVNAGMFFIRDTPWSRNFLDLWWNQTSFVLPFGNSKSGDNDALKFLLKEMPKEERAYHILVPPMQCVFNSYLWVPTWKSVFRLLGLTRTVWRGAYSEGDFMVHFAGLDNKKDRIEAILNHLQEG